MINSIESKSEMNKRSSHYPITKVWSGIPFCIFTIRLSIFKIAWVGVLREFVALWVGLWKEILKEFSWVKENWSFIIGNGTKIRFWLDT